MPDRATCKLEKTGHGLSLTVTGGLTVENAREIKKAMLGALAEGPKVHLEIGEISSVDLSFIQMLFAACAKAEAAGRALTVAAPEGFVQAVEAAGFPTLPNLMTK